MANYASSSQSNNIYPKSLSMDTVIHSNRYYKFRKRYGIDDHDIDFENDATVGDYVIDRQTNEMYIVTAIMRGPNNKITEITIDNLPTASSNGPKTAAASSNGAATAASSSNGGKYKRRTRTQRMKKRHTTKRHMKKRRTRN